jgi:hypothetical protein
MTWGLPDRGGSKEKRLRISAASVLLIYFAPLIEVRDACSCKGNLTSLWNITQTMVKEIQRETGGDLLT